MLLFEHHRLWTSTSCGHSQAQKLEMTVAPGYCVSRGRCLPVKLKTGAAVQSHSERQQLLWRQYFLDASCWWECRQEKKSSRSPESKDPLWLNNIYKPGRVDAQLTLFDKRVRGRPQLKANPTLQDTPGPPALVKCQGHVTAHTVSKLCEKGTLSETVEALTILVQTESVVSTSLLYSVLKRCVAEKNVVVGRRVHDLTVKLGYESNAFLGNHILRMYASRGRLQEAMNVFTRVGKPDAFIWFSIISSHAKHGKPAKAIQLYYEMRSSGVKADGHVFVAALQACAFAADLESGRQVHTHVLQSGVLPDSFVCNCLVDMYAKCGELEDARRVFDSLATKDVVTWNALIAGYAQHGLGQEALVLYEQMEQDGLILADHFTFACLLKACASAGALHLGRQLHSKILERRQLEGNIVVGNCLVDMYAKFGELEDARIVFDSLASKDVVTWTTLIAGYAKHGLGQEALVLYGQMEQEGLILANHVTFGCLLKACATAGALQLGRQLHSKILERGQLESDLLVGTCLVDMYAKCGELEDARRLFDTLASKDVVTWNALIAGYAQHGLGQEALVLYGEMEQEGLILADHVTFGCLLKACATTGALQLGRQLHSQILERGQLEGHILVGNCLVHMYAKCGELEDARRVFDSLASKDVVTWNTLIAGCGSCDEAHNALACFEEMVVAGIQPNDTTFTCLLVACSHEGLVNEGRKHFNSMVEQHGVKPTMEHYSCMIDLLGRAGHLDEAENILLSCESQNNVVGLTSLLHACKSHGDIERATRCFESLVRLDPQQASAYVLVANVYADAGRWTDVERVETLRKLAGANKKPAVAGIEVKKQVHTFIVGENKDDISQKVVSMNSRLKEEGGHVPQTKLVLKPLSEKEKEDELCGHAEKLALAFGLLNTASGTPLLVTKNLRMCRDCHNSTEIMSRIEKRDIVVRDAYRVHRFAAGSCSCQGRP